MKINSTLKKILGILAIALVVLITIRFVKMMPAIMKMLALAANVVTIFLAVQWMKDKKNKETEDESESKKGVTASEKDFSKN